VQQVHVIASLIAYPDRHDKFVVAIHGLGVDALNPADSTLEVVPSGKVTLLWAVVLALPNGIGWVSMKPAWR
jgi:hypothetical protein